MLRVLNDFADAAVYIMLRAFQIGALLFSISYFFATIVG